MFACFLDSEDLSRAAGTLTIQKNSAFPQMNCGIKI
ncbi:hypothetical protein P872_19065 [Rhodonellum psychrophilum GCM71 = DSM 17998]|uniref:Uncharacterized protein n=1 Tax=Rhodonellum psychrophilum GCM71 = DSM 17998 TaxID=1123057 RepID=U5C041_9BACT|nr:hypothetical protein P872_19065 [Rhodonellum psychrophilum GCM71 = DSM 17998]